MHTKLTIPERLKDLRVSEKKMSLQELSDATGIPCSTLGNYSSHIETEQYYLNILSEDLKPIVSDLRNAHMKDSDTASDIDYQSMVKSIIDDFTLQAQITADANTESSNEAYINGLLLLFCKNLEMNVTQLSAEEKQILK